MCCTPDVDVPVVVVLEEFAGAAVGGVEARGGGAGACTDAGVAGTTTVGVVVCEGAVDVPIAAAAEYRRGGREGVARGAGPDFTTEAIGCCT